MVLKNKLRCARVDCNTVCVFTSFVLLMGSYLSSDTAFLSVQWALLVFSSIGIWKYTRETHQRQEVLLHLNHITCCNSLSLSSLSLLFLPLSLSLALPPSPCHSFSLSLDLLPLSSLSTSPCLSSSSFLSLRGRARDFYPTFPTPISLFH